MGVKIAIKHQKNMVTIVTSVIARKMTNTNRFINLTVAKNGLILENHNKRKIEIHYEELDKVYIKKYKINPFIEFLCIALPFVFVHIALQYLPFYLTIFGGVFAVHAVFMHAINSKWYQFFVFLKDGTFYKKRVSMRTKSENFSIINRVEKEFFNYKSNLLASA
jgi:hypothetical protein